MSNTKSLLADFLYAVLAGMAIALGGAVFLALDNKILGALFFTVGLFTVRKRLQPVHRQGGLCSR